MLRIVFLNVLSLSITGTATGLGILLLKTVFRYKLSVRVHYYVWLVAMLFFLLPFRQLLPQAVPPSPTVGIVWQVLQSAEMPSKEQDIYYTPYQSYISNSNSLDIPFHFLWAAGVMGFFVIQVIRYYRIKRRLLKSSVTCEKLELDALSAAAKRINFYKTVRILRSPLLQTPIAFGLIEPVIVLSDNQIMTENLEMILIHELLHLKQRDLTYKFAALIITGLHWFNPVCYLMLADINSCGELYCDRHAIAILGEEKKTGYCKMLLEATITSNKIPIEPTTSFGSKRKLIKRRIYAIMNDYSYRRYVRVVAVLVIVAVSAFAVACSPVISKPVENPADIIGESSSLTVVNESSETAVSSEETKEYDSSDSLEKTASIVGTESANQPEQAAWMWPVVGSNDIIKRFEGETSHRGIDIATEKGSSVVAAQDGIVIVAKEREGGYGRYIMVDHGGGVQTLYAHCDSLLAKTGQTVKAGDVIAYSGDSGNTPEEELHFEVRINGMYTDPEQYFVTP